MTTDAFKNPDAHALIGSSPAILKKTNDLIAAFQEDHPTTENQLAWTLSTGRIHSLKIDGVKQSKNGLVYSLDVSKEALDTGYGLSYTLSPVPLKTILWRRFIKNGILRI
jgi:hypothetical protein